MRRQPDGLRRDEADTLQTFVDRSGRRWLAMAVGMLLLAVFPFFLYAVMGKGHWDHLAGRSEPVAAQVESVWVDGTCRTGVDNYKAELSWTMGGVSGQRTYSYCSDPEVGDTLQVWVGPSGHAEVDSPWEFRIALGAMGIVLSLMLGSVFAAFAVRAQRQRRRLLALAGSALLPAIPVQLDLIRSAKSQRLWMRGIDTMPDSATHDVTVRVVLYTAEDGAVYAHEGVKPFTRTRKKVTGSWWLHAAPSNHPKRQAGLLVRGSERCWIDFPVGSVDTIAGDSA